MRLERWEPFGPVLHPNARGEDVIDETTLGDGFLSTREVADLLRVTPRAVRKMVAAGRLQGYKRGPHGGLLITRRSVLVLLEHPAWQRARHRAEVA